MQTSSSSSALVVSPQPSIYNGHVGEQKNLTSRRSALAHAKPLDAPETVDDRPRVAGAIAPRPAKQQGLKDQEPWQLEFSGGAVLMNSVTDNTDQAEPESTTSQETTSDQHVPRNRKQGSKHSRKSGTGTRTYTRQRTAWTDQEIEDLVKGVTIYGKGRWTSILEHPQLHFQEGRTAMDLKDRSVRLC